jgi:lysophospholipase L1-like esterase
MVYKLIKSITIAGLLFLLASCSDNGSTSSGGGSSEPPTKIVAFGDSIGARFPNWPTIVSQNTGVPLANYSQDSLRTSHFVGRTNSILDSEKPSHLLILLGTNDARVGIVDGAVSNLQAMADSANARGITVIIGTIPPNLQDPSSNVRAAAISDGIRSLQGARIAEVRGALGDGAGLFPDGLHPNEAGSSIIAGAFIDQL